MQVVGEKLSLHVLANYEEFVRGVNEVASIEQDLQVLTSELTDYHQPRPLSTQIAQLRAPMYFRPLQC